MLVNRKINQKKLWGCIISGVLAALSFSSKSLWGLSFIALIPLFIVLLKGNNTKKEMVLYVMTYGISYHMILLYWLFILAPVFPVNIHIARILLAFGILLIGIINGTFLAAPICLFSYTRKGKGCDIFYLPFLYILGEWLQEHLLPIALPWGRIGAAVTPFSPFIQSASLFGSLFTSFLVLLVNAFVAYIFISVKVQPICRGDFIIISFSILLVLVNIGGGYLRIAIMEKEAPVQEVLLVQGNHSGLSKWNITPDKILEEYIGLTKKNITDHTKIVLWPETAIPVYFKENNEMIEQVIKICRDSKVIVILGAFMREEHKGEWREYNALFQVNENGVGGQAYYKQVLVPFGEYLPFEKIVTRLFPDFSVSIKELLNISPGEEGLCFTTPYGKIGGIICFESIFSSIARKEVRNGAEIFAVASNDSWFSDSPALYEHHAHSILRAVEYGKYLIRASNTAVTSIISNTGTVTAVAAPFEQTVLRSNVNFTKKNTLYGITGDIILIPSIFLCIRVGIKILAKITQKLRCR